MSGDHEARCEICGEPMPPGEQMFKIHGYSGDCPKPPKAVTTESEPMSEDRALEIAIYCANVPYAYGLAERVKARVVLQSLRERLERERAFLEAAKALCERHGEMDGLNYAEYEKVRALRAAYRTLTAPPEGKS